MDTLRLLGLWLRNEARGMNMFEALVCCFFPCPGTGLQASCGCTLCSGLRASSVDGEL